MKGFINIYKPQNMSSSFAVQKVKKILTAATGEKQKVGHFGTLDPLAAGVLPIAVGKATRLFDYAQDKVKVYQTTFRFGATTDTLDREGEIVERCGKIVTEDEIQDALKGFAGKIDQVPPLYSAKSVNGKRAYKIAREGGNIELKPKRIEIFEFSLIKSSNGKVVFKDGEHSLSDGEFAFQIACSSGTYIRALARDLAQAVGTVGYMSSLLRIQSGSFIIENSVTLEEFEDNLTANILPLSVVLNDYKSFDLPKECKKQALNGVLLHFDNLPQDNFVVKLDGEIIGIAKNIDNKLKFITRF